MDAHLGRDSSRRQARGGKHDYRRVVYKVGKNGISSGCLQGGCKSSFAAGSPGSQGNVCEPLTANTSKTKWMEFPAKPVGQRFKYFAPAGVKAWNLKQRDSRPRDTVLCIPRTPANGVHVVMIESRLSLFTLEHFVEEMDSIQSNDHNHLCLVVLNHLPDKLA